MKTVPPNYIRPDLLVNGSTNGSVVIRETNIEPWAEVKLKTNKEVGYFSCHEFWGNIWYDEKFYCEVWVHKEHIDTVEADSLEELVEKCTKYIDPE